MGQLIALATVVLYGAYVVLRFVAQGVIALWKTNRSLKALEAPREEPVRLREAADAPVESERINAPPVEPVSPPARALPHPYRASAPVTTSIFDDPARLEEEARREFEKWACMLPMAPKDPGAMVQEIAPQKRLIGRLRSTIDARKLLERWLEVERKQRTVVRLHAVGVDLSGFEWAREHRDAADEVIAKDVRLVDAVSRGRSLEARELPTATPEAWRLKWSELQEKTAPGERVAEQRFQRSSAAWPPAESATRACRPSGCAACATGRARRPGFAASAPSWRRSAKPRWPLTKPRWRLAKPHWRLAKPHWRLAKPHWRLAKPCQHLSKLCYQRRRPRQCSVHFACPGRRCCCAICCSPRSCCCTAGGGRYRLTESRV